MNAALVAVVGSIPSPPRSSIPIGPFDLRAYGLTIALGVIAAVWLTGRRLEQKGIGTIDDISSVAVWAVTAGVIGARLYHVATDWSRFSDDLGAIPKIWEGGLGIPGGMAAGVAVGWWRSRYHDIPGAMMLTCAAPALPLAQAIGRLGNWFNQELYGRATDLPWALEIDDDHLPAGVASGTTFHPTFLYEALWNLGLVGVLLRIDRTMRLGPGRLLAVYVIGYGAGRLWIEGLRIDPASELGGLRWNQWVSIAAVVLGALYLVATRGQKWPDDVSTEPADDSADDAAEDAADDGIDDAADDSADDAADDGIDDAADDSADDAADDGIDDAADDSADDGIDDISPPPLSDDARSVD
jgi:prolipoprotein diacylglyceryl transferase